MAHDRPTRVSVDLLEDAAAEGARESRSAKQQIDHWARIGRAVSAPDTVERRRIAAAVAGELAFDDLGPEERRIAHATIDAGIEAAAIGASFGTELVAEGMTTVAVDDEGRLVEHRPDGSSVLLG